MKENEFAIPRRPCPHCGRQNDRATNIDRDGAPEPGSVVICMHCVGISLYDQALVPQKASPEDLARLRATEHWPRIQRAVRTLLRVKGRK